MKPERNKRQLYDLVLRAGRPIATEIISRTRNRYIQHPPIVSRVSLVMDESAKAIALVMDKKGMTQGSSIS
jgi:hypothetical protein